MKFSTNLNTRLVHHIMAARIWPQRMGNMFHNLILMSYKITAFFFTTLACLSPPPRWPGLQMDDSLTCHPINDRLQRRKCPYKHPLSLIANITYWKRWLSSTHEMMRCWNILIDKPGGCCVIETVTEGCKRSANTCFAHTVF